MDGFCQSVHWEGNDTSSMLSDWKEWVASADLSVQEERTLPSMLSNWKEWVVSTNLSIQEKRTLFSMPSDQKGRKL
jgi:hypothetical protein